MKRRIVLGSIAVALVAALTVVFVSSTFADPLPPGLPCTPTSHGSDQQLSQPPLPCGGEFRV
jgi:hypothetical protein